MDINRSSAIAMLVASVAVIDLTSVLGQQSLEELRERVRNNPNSALVLEPGRVGDRSDAEFLPTLTSAQSLSEESRINAQ